MLEAVRLTRVSVIPQAVTCGLLQLTECTAIFAASTGRHDAAQETAGTTFLTGKLFCDTTVITNMSLSLLLKSHTNSGKMKSNAWSYSWSNSVALRNGLTSVVTVTVLHARSLS